jgi:type IV pilus assembly protein PilA
LIDFLRINQLIHQKMSAVLEEQDTMTQTPGEPIPGGTPKQGGVPVFVWVLGGCGCLTVGGFVFLVLLAIALPSFLNQVGKARGSEATSTLGTLNRAQQAFHLENKSFANSLNDLDARITPNFFSYEVVPSNSRMETFTTAIPVSSERNLKSYIGFVFLSNLTTSEGVSGICATDSPSQTPPLPPRPIGLKVECAPGSSLVP